VTPTQCVAARALLRWTQKDLARMANLSSSVVADFERCARTPLRMSVEEIERTFIKAGLSFVSGGVVWGTSGTTLPGMSPEAVDALTAYVDARVHQVLVSQTQGVAALMDADVEHRKAKDRLSKIARND
jgi:transcriptional regulator with XRE-family HTH domain